MKEEKKAKIGLSILTAVITIIGLITAILIGVLDPIRNNGEGTKAGAYSTALPEDITTNVDKLKEYYTQEMGHYYYSLPSHWFGIGTTNNNFYKEYFKFGIELNADDMKSNGLMLWANSQAPTAPGSQLYYPDQYRVFSLTYDETTSTTDANGYTYNSYLLISGGSTGTLWTNKALNTIPIEMPEISYLSINIYEEIKYAIDNSEFPNYKRYDTYFKITLTSPTGTSNYYKMAYELYMGGNGLDPIPMASVSILLKRTMYYPIYPQTYIKTNIAYDDTFGSQNASPEQGTIVELCNQKIYTKGFGYVSQGTTSEEIKQAYQQGYEAGKSNGYQEGYAEGLGQGDNSFLALMTAVVDAPVQTFMGLLDFNVLGFNLSTIVIGLLSLALVLKIISLLTKGK